MSMYDYGGYGDLGIGNPGSYGGTNSPGLMYSSGGSPYGAAGGESLYNMQQYLPLIQSVLGTKGGGGGAAASSPQVQYPPPQPQPGGGAFYQASPPQPIIVGAPAAAGGGGKTGGGGMGGLGGLGDKNGGGGGGEQEEGLEGGIQGGVGYGTTAARVSGGNPYVWVPAAIYGFGKGYGWW